MKAIWNNTIIAESNHTILVEGNHYFPVSSIKHEYFTPSQTTSRCIWKGKAHYYSILVNNVENIDAAWYYPNPTFLAKKIEHHIAFWKGVRIVE